MFNVAMIYGEGPARLTAEEAERLASRCFLYHDHLATTPQDAVFWVRIPEDHRA